MGRVHDDILIVTMRALQVLISHSRSMCSLYVPSIKITMKSPLWHTKKHPNDSLPIVHQPSEQADYHIPHDKTIAVA